MANSVIALSLRLLTLLFLKSSKAVLIVSIAICSLGASLFVTLDVSDEVQHIPSAPHVTSVQLTLLEQSLLFKFRRSNCGLFSVVLVFLTHVQFVLPYGA